MDLVELAAALSARDGRADRLYDHYLSHAFGASSNDSDITVSSHQDLPGDSIFFFVDVFFGPC